MIHLQLTVPASLAHNKVYLLIRGILVIVGGFLVHLSLGTLYTFGNIAPYIVSYIRNQSHPAGLTQGTATWLFALNLMGQGGAMFLGGWMVRKIGPRWTTLIGGWIMSLGVGLTYFTIKVSFWLVLLTYGLLFGIGVGIGYTGPLSTAMKWLPKWKGFANGIVVAGFGLGALIFNFVQTFYVNPGDISAQDHENGEDYFTDPDLIHRVPRLFLILGGSYAVMQLIGSLLLTNPPEGFAVASNERTPELYKSDAYREVDDNSYRCSRKPLKNGTASINAVRRSASSQSSSPPVSPPPGPTVPPDSEFDSSSKSTAGPELNGFSDDALDAERGEKDEEVELLRDNTSPNYSRETSPDNTSYTSRSSSVSWSRNVITSLKPFQMVKKQSFYMLWFAFLFNGLAVLFTATLYKFFGLRIKAGDHFLAAVGSVSAILNCVGRIVWGIVADKVSYKFALTIISSIMTIFLLTIYIASQGSKWLFLVWVCVLFFCIGGNFSVFPTAVARAYGIQYVSVNYGTLFTSQVVAGCVGALLSTFLKTHLDYSWLFFVISAISGLGLVVVLVYRPKRYISLVLSN
jgi:MFS family permease